MGRCGTASWCGVNLAQIWSVYSRATTSMRRNPVRVAKSTVTSTTMPAKSVAPSILIVSPYLAAANNGNWRTAARWARLLERCGYQALVQADADGPAARAAACMIALHARRSHPAIRSWRASGPARPLIVTLTGTDLYGDLPAGNADCAASLDAADALIVLQDDAVNHLPARHRGKAHVVFQSAPLLRTAVKPGTRLNCVMVGHLRAEKAPLTALAAWRLLPADEPIYLRHLGDALDPDLGKAATAMMANDRRYRWLGAVPHPAARQAIRRAHLLLVPSVMEGGANVVVEALTAGTAVLGSRMSGNVGMLGARYPGLFEVGDSAQLAALLLRARHEPAFLARLESTCGRKAPRFAPAAEQRALHRLVARMLQTAGITIPPSRGAPSRRDTRRKLP